MNAKKKSISSDLKRLDKMTNADIDYSDIPQLDDTFFNRATVVLPQKKDSVTLKIDHNELHFQRKISIVLFCDP